MKNMLLGACIVVMVTNARAQTDTVATGKSADEMARELSNPTAAIGSLNFFFDYVVNTGDLPNADDQSSFALNFQPALPKPNVLWGQNLFVRPLIPVLFNPKVYQPDEQDFDNAGFNLGDISYDIALGNTTGKGLLYFVGLAGTIPTATDSRIRGDWTLGPEIALGVFKEKFIGGMLASQRWNFADGDERQSVFGGQYFYAIPMGNGHVIGAGPNFSYNWKSETLTLPLGAGYSKTTKIGKTGFKYGFQLWYYVAQADPFGPLWTIRFQLTPVVPLPW